MGARVPRAVRDGGRGNALRPGEALSGPDPKPAARVSDRAALRLARLSGAPCGACGHPPGGIHHVIPRGEGGDDVAGNLIPLCGSGTTRCHGAYHGNPYLLKVGDGWERRDAAWVSRRIGHTILTRRRDIAAYVFAKLGDEPGRAYLLRRYGITVVVP